VLALLRLGAVSVSLSSRAVAEAAALPQMASVVCARGDVPAGMDRLRAIEISSDAFAPAAATFPELPTVEEAEGTAGRICFTSGSAGAPKAILLDGATLRARLGGTARRSLLDGHSVLWCGLGPDSAYGFTATLAAWLCGGTVMFTGRLETGFQQIVQAGVNLVIASPAVLSAVLRSQPDDTAHRIEGSVIVAGGPLSAKLRDLLLLRLCRDVFVAYGSSEAGGVTLAKAEILDEGAGSVGAAFPDVELQVVDDDGHLLPPGEIGRVRIRTDSCVRSYIHDPVATARHFSDGWFYPGDTGRLSAGGALTLARREEEVLNIGGTKLSAPIIEALLRDQPGIDDGAAIAVSDASGMSRLLVLATGEPTAMPHLAPALRTAIPGLPPFHIVPVSMIPRSAMGKINREELARRVLDLLDRRGTRGPSDDFHLLRKPD